MKNLAVVLVLCGLIHSGPAHAISAMTGSQLLTFCESANSTEQAACIMYLNGVLDGQIARKLLAIEQGRKSGICIPDTVDPLLMKRLFVDYAHRHLGALAYAAAAMIIFALDEQYACPP